MNPKIALFLSTTLTAFVVATLSGVVNKVTSTTVAQAMAPQAEVQQAATATLEQPTDLPTATSQTPVDPMLAATLASKAIEREDVYSVETTTYNGVDAYKVVFSSGDVVYIGLDAQVLEKTKLKPVVVNVVADPPKKRNKNSNGDNQGSNVQSSNTSGEHESEVEHEDEHEDGH